MTHPYKIWNDVAALRHHCDKLLTNDQTIGFARGCFDLLHDGHRYFLDQARKNCDFLIVSVPPDDYIKATKGQDRPINNRIERARKLSALNDVDAITICPPEASEDKREYKIIKADIAFFGGDYTQGNLPKAYLEFAPKIAIIKQQVGPRTTDLVNEMKNKKP